MTKYFLAALFIHGLLFLSFNKNKTLGNPEIFVKKNIPISYNTVSAEQRIDGMNKTKKNEIKEEISETKIETPEKIQKTEPEIKSKISNNKEKKSEKKKQIKKSEKNKNIEKNNMQKTNADDIFTKNENFTINSDGTYTAVSSKGINFEIISQTDPDYPKQAEVIRYNKTVTVEVRFLVDLNGNIEDVKILKSHEKFGFDREVLSALKKWKFKPIEYKGRKIKVYFTKEFVFTPKL